MDEIWVRKRKTCWRSHLEKIGAVFSADPSCSRSARPRLTAYGGSSFEPILQAFHQEDFIALVQQLLGKCMQLQRLQHVDGFPGSANKLPPKICRSLNVLILTKAKTRGFVPQCVPMSTVKSIVCPTLLVRRFVTEHAPYKDIFENRLSRILQQLDVEQHDFASFCDWLKVNADIFEDDTEGLYPFLSSITASLEPCLQIWSERIEFNLGSV